MLSKKKSRPITVDGEAYRWAIAPNHTFVTLVVQYAEENGQKLEIIIPTDINRMWLEFLNTRELNLKAVTPAAVSKIIKDALTGLTLRFE